MRNINLIVNQFACVKKTIATKNNYKTTYPYSLINKIDIHKSRFTIEQNI